MASAIKWAACVLGHKTAVGGTWMVSARLVSRLLDLVAMLVLARILLPKDFGLVAIAMSLIYIVEAALELPVSQALVQLRDLEREHYDTAFTLSLSRGCVLCAIVCSVAWPFSRFYGDSRLFLLTCVLSAAPVARGLVSPRLADFSKRLDFSPDFIMEFSGKCLAIIVAITTGLLAHSYWSIVAITVITPLAGTIVSYVIAPYRPRLSLEKLPAFSGFLGWITAAQIVGALNWQTDRLLLGKLTSRAALGQFAAANDASNIPIAALFSPILRPLLSAFTALRDDIGRLRSSYLNSSTGIVTLGLPILLCESMLAYPIVRLLFGPKWLEAAPLLRWLALSLVPGLFALPMAPLVMSFGKTRIFFNRNLFEVCVKLPLVIVGAIKYGFMGVIFARCISETATVMYSIYIVHNLLGISVVRQLVAPWRSLVSICGMAAVLAALTMNMDTGASNSHLLVVSIAIVVAGLATYVFLLWLLWLVAGRPSGIEAMVSGYLKARTRHSGIVPSISPLTVKE
jgi:O-antigen/teichoic acid export membrane protein